MGGGLRRDGLNAQNVGGVQHSFVQRAYHCVMRLSNGEMQGISCTKIDVFLACYIGGPMEVERAHRENLEVGTDVTLEDQFRTLALIWRKLARSSLERHCGLKFGQCPLAQAKIFRIKG